MKIQIISVALTSLILAADLPGASGLNIEKTIALTPRPQGKFLGLSSGDAFVVVENGQSEAPRIKVYNADGSFAVALDFRIEGARLINVYNGRYTRSVDGYIAVTGSAFNGNNQGSAFLAILAPDGAVWTVIRTSPYVAYALVFSSDGVLWTAGGELVDGN